MRTAVTSGQAGEDPRSDIVRVLVVDDDPEVRVLARHMLERGGFTVAEAANSAEALALIENASIQVIVLDHDLMEGVNGLELAAAIASTHPMVRVLMFSAFLSDAGRFAGVDAILDKMHAERLLSTVQRLARTTRVA